MVRSLAVGHRGLGHRVVVAAVLEPSPSEHPFVRALDGSGLEVVPLQIRRRAYLAERAAITRLCQGLRPDIVHTHGYRSDVLAAGVARQLGFPTVTTVHGFTGGDWRDRLYERLQRRAFRRFDAVVAVSGPLGHELVRSGVPPDRLYVIRNAWDGAVDFRDRATARRELGVPLDGVRIGWVGRLSPEKGADVLLDAFALLPDGLASLSVLGDGDALSGLKRRGEALGVADRITWHGAVPEAATLLPAFDVLVLSSRTEGTPMILFEAIAAGVPVVATQVGGVPDVVSPTEALLVPPEDPAALGAAVRKTLEHSKAARERACAALRRVQRDFAVGPWLERYEALYSSLQAARATAVRA